MREREEREWGDLVLCINISSPLEEKSGDIGMTIGTGHHERGVPILYQRWEREERGRLTLSLGSTGSPEASSRVISSRLPFWAAVWMGRVGPVREGEGELMTRREDAVARTHSTDTHHQHTPRPKTSRLNERLRARGEARETEIERASGGEKKKIGLMAGRGGVWPGQPWVVEIGRD
jgi:hypothetical protein